MLNLYLLSIIILILIIYLFRESLLTEAQICKLKYGLYVFTVMSASIIFFPILLIHPRSARNIRTAGIILNPILSLFGLKYRIENGQVFDRVDACVIVANHQSSIDFIGMMKLWPEHIRYCTILAKKELLYALPFGLSAWLAGVEFVDRKNRERAKDKISNLTKKVQEKSLRLWVFPEGNLRKNKRRADDQFIEICFFLHLIYLGTRHMSESLLPFKYGAFRLAIEAQIPIVPVVFSNYQSIYNANEKNNSFYWRSGTITIKCLEPIDTKGLTIENDLQQLTDNVRQRMIETFQE